MKLYDLIKENEYESDFELPFDLEIENITTHIEDIGSSTLFVLVESIKFDIKNIISYIESKKPALIIAEKKYATKSSSSRYIYVKNARKALAYLYSRFYKIDYSKMKFIGITGTNGKTTTASMLQNILLSADKRCGFIGTGRIEINRIKINEENYSMTTPDPELLYSSISKMQKENCEYVVMEVSSHALFFFKTAPIPFSVSIFTNLSEEHMDFHKNKEEYFRSKMLLFDNTKIAIFNVDDEASKRASDLFSGEKYTVGIFGNADCMARDITQITPYSYEYIYKEKSALFKLSLPQPGIYNIYNSMFAVKAALLLGIKRDDVKNGIKEIEKIDGRFEIINTSPTVIIDYAHTEFALRSFLKTLNSLKKEEQKIILVFGCGGERDAKKRPLMARAAEELSDFCIVTSDNSRTEPKTNIIKDILSGFENSNKKKVIISRKNAIEYAISTAEEKDIVAIVGKGHERYNIDDCGYHNFDEREIVKSAVIKLKSKIIE